MRKALLIALFCTLAGLIPVASAAESQAKPCGKGPNPVPCPSPTPTPTPTPAPVPTPTPTPPTNDCTVILTSGQTIVPTTGAVICLRNGHYPGFSSSASDWTLKSYPGEWGYIDGDLSTTRAHLVDISGGNVTISRVTFEDAKIQWGAGLWISGTGGVHVGPNVEFQRNKSFGAKLANAANVTIETGNFHENDTAIEISGNGANVNILNNWIWNHSTMVVNTVGGSGDRGANAVVFFRVTGPVVVDDNEIWNNRAVSLDFGLDGEAFNIFESSGLIIRNNRMWDNEATLESGSTQPTPNSYSFTGNVVWRPETSTAPVQGDTDGLIVRACHGCDISSNRFYDFDGGWTFLVVTSDFTGGVTNQNIDFHHNQVEQSEGKAVSVNNWTGVATPHDNTYYLEQTGTVGYSPLGTNEVVINGPNPTRP
jgi:hypothetical protein